MYTHNGCNAMCELNAPDLVLGTGMKLPHSATLNEMNCATANIFNTFKVLRLICNVEELQLDDLTDFKSVMKKLCNGGHNIIQLDKEHDFEALGNFLSKHRQPMIVRLETGTLARHVIGIVPNDMVEFCIQSSKNNQLLSNQFSIVDGSHQLRGLLPFNEKNLTWCSSGFTFVSVKKG